MKSLPLSLRWLLAAFVLLGLVYSYAVPIWESPDEWNHFGMAQFINLTGTLPVQIVGQPRPYGYGQEGSQPPLYYLIAAGVIAPFDRSDFDAVLEPNPHAIIGDPNEIGDKNFKLHDQLYPPPLYGTALAVYAVRLFSTLLGAVTVAAVYASARLLVPDQPAVALLAAGLTAFNPQFVFISVSVNNDNLVTALNSLTIWQMLLLLRDGFHPRRSLILGVLIALASLSKLSGLVLLPVVGLAALWVAVRRRDWRGFWAFAGLVGGVWVIGAGWWYARNLLLYGELFGTQRMLDIFGRRPPPPLTELLTEEFEGLRISYWGLFGWFNVFTVRPFYWIMDGLTALGVIGGLAYLWRRRRAIERVIPVLLLALFLALGGVSLISWTMQTAASQGRLLFPFIAAGSSLMALGLVTLRIPARVIVLPLGAFALAVPLITLIPEYAPPAAVANLPESAIPLEVRFGDVDLVGYETPLQRYGPGDRVPVTLYWKPLQTSTLDYSLFIRLLDPADEIIASLPTYPGSGSLRTSAWQPGVIYRDPYSVRIPNDTRGHWPLRLHVGWWKYPEGFGVDPVDASGQPLGNLIVDGGAFAASDDSDILPVQTVDPVDFGGTIRLLGYALDGDTLRLWWETTSEMREDFTILVLALAEPYQVGGENTIVAQGDAQPPLPTRYWRVGERFISTHVLQLNESAPAEGEFPIYVGWYSTLYPARLDAACPDNACLLTTLSR
ncbi:MAG: glycosyltransferase family 39 protein [Anaerolineae bacterium]|nr:glycosyltransferase family 39 protein [Anaerolineae bacterium]